MFDIGVWELFVIGVVALIVIGPEELPRVARTTGHLLGRLRRYVSDVKSDIGREMEMADLKRMQETVTESARELHQSLNEQARELEREFSQTAAEVSAPAVEAPAAAEPLPEPLPLPVPASVQEAPGEPAVEKDENQLDLFGGAPADKARS